MQTKKRKYLAALLALLLLLLGLFWLKAALAPTTIPENIISGETLPQPKDAHKMNEQALAAYAQSLVDKSKFNMVIKPTGTVDAKSLMGQVDIQNPSSNAYPISVDLQDDETKKILYSTGGIQPGYEVTEIHLTQSLSPGRHQVTALFSIYDQDSKKLQGRTSAEITLTVH